MKIALFYKNLIGSSVWNLANDAVPILENLGHEVELVSAGKQWPKQTDVLVNFQLDYTPKIIKAFRYQPVKKMVNVLAHNVDEYKPSDLVKYMLYHTYKDIPLIVPSDFSFYKLWKFSSAWFSPSKAIFFRENMKLNHFGITEGFAPGNNNRDKFIVPMNRWHNAGKQIKAHHFLTTRIKTLLPSTSHTMYYAPDMMYVNGYKVSVEEITEAYGTYEYDTVVQPDTKLEYQNNVKDAGIFMSTARSESFGLYYLELLESGVVGCFLDFPWIRKLLPGYRYRAFGHNELTNLVKWVYDNYDEASDYVKTDVIPYIKKAYRYERFLNDLLAIL